MTDDKQQIVTAKPADGELGLDIMMTSPFDCGHTDVRYYHSVGCKDEIKNVYCHTCRNEES